jgi:hypothetical protein
VAWLPIDPRYLRQPLADGDAGAGGCTLAYVSHGERDAGHLVVYLDGRGRLERFELIYARFLSCRELVAEWDRATGLRVGEIDDGDAQDGDMPRTGGGRAGGPRPHGSPLIRRYRHPSPADIGLLLAYVERNAAPLDGQHRATVLDVLRNGLPSSSDNTAR